MSVSIIVNQNPAIIIPWQSNLNGQQALETAYNQIQNSHIFSFGIDYYGSYDSGYGSLGYLVIMLNGIYDLPTQSNYWAFLVNGVYANQGIDYTFLSDGSIVTFLNQTYAEPIHRGTLLEAKHQRYHGK